MASMQEYLEKMSDKELQGILTSYYAGRLDIAMDAAFQICCILAKRNPELPNPHLVFRKMCRAYCKTETSIDNRPYAFAAASFYLVGADIIRPQDAR